MSGSGYPNTIPPRITESYLADIIHHQPEHGRDWVEKYVEQLQAIRLRQSHLLVIGRQRASKLIGLGDPMNAAMIEALCDEIEHLMGVSA